MNSYEIKTKDIVDADVEAAFEWYEGEEPGLGYEFLDELRAAYHRIQDGPFEIPGTSLWNSTRNDQAIPLCNLFLGGGRSDRRVGGSSRRERSGSLAAADRIEL